MYIFKNAIISITRNKSRNILLGIIILVIGCATTVTLAIRSSADKLIDSYSNKYDIEATISVNRDNMMSGFKKGDDNGEEISREDRVSSMSDMFSEANNITIDDINNYASSNYVSSYYYTQSIGMNSNNISKASSSFGKEEDNNTSFGNKEDVPNMQSGDFTVIGYSSYEAMNDFVNGSYKIIEGEISDQFDASNCVINSELSTLNEIAVGDTITLVSANDESITYDLVVTGIYEENEDSSNEMSMFTGSANTIITNVTTIQNISSSDENLSVTTSPTFILTSKDVIDDFTNEVSDKGLSEYLTITTNLDTIESATSSIANLKTFATTFLVITLIIGVIVLLVINAINIRERKYEIGVLRTIGMKKSLLTCQFAIELLIITLVGLTIGASIGSISSVAISNKLLESEISSSVDKEEDVSNNFGKGGNMGGFDMTKMSGVNKIQAYDSIDAVVDIKVLLELFGIGIILTLISSISSMISIQKFSPLQILKERS